MSNTTKDSSLPHFNLDKISLEEKIGEGNAVVYRAMMEGKAMAAKKMSCDKNQIPHEVDVHSSLLPHPNILTLLGVAHTKDGFTIYICMELAEKSLFQYLHEEKKKPSFEQSTKWATQIAKGMHHIHQHGVAHRDLKSANVLLFDNEENIKLCDFGSARLLERTASLTGMTGTCRWMAPEFNNKAGAPINQRCDVFSYGMLLYELFTHKVPFSEIKEGVHVLPRIHNGERPIIPSELPSRIQKFIESCWKHEPHDRPSSKEILQILDLEKLWSAAESGDANAVQQLIDHIDIDSRTMDGGTALHLAAARGHTSLVQLLIGAHANLNLQDKSGCSPLYVARQRAHNEVVETLLMNGADPNLVWPAAAQPDLDRQLSYAKWPRESEIREDGMFGKVYKCYNQETGERVVMKEISLQEGDCVQVQKAIIERTDALRELNHPNVLKFIGVEFHDTELYVFMEYCGDGTLQEFVAQGLQEDRVRRHTRDLLEAVEALHSHDIVHRNIQSSSIYLSSNGSTKLGDFGMALELKGNLSKKTLKEHDAVISYLSPEAVLRQEYGKPMDIWSVGCVVVEMAAGKKPWSGYSKEDIIMKLSSGESPTVQSKVLGKEGQDFVQTHCFITDPEKRATAVQLLKHDFIKGCVIIDKKDLNLEAGKYLGGGALGDVYSGIWLSRNMKVAIKKVRGEPSESGVEMLSSLSPHPNIIAFYGYAHTRFYTNIVTELAEKGSLYNRLHPEQMNMDKGKQVEKPTQEKSLEWAKEIAQGMVFLHHLEIIHCNLKSRNVLLTADDTAKLCDFATTCCFPKHEMGKGSYRWMAPELLDGGSADKHSDIYSFSMVMWELMAHKIPFHDIEDELDAASSALENERPQLDKAWPEYIRALIEKCWDRRPHSRPSFDNIVTALWHKSS